MKKLMLMLLLTLCASIAYGQAAKDGGARQPDQWLDVPNTALEIGFADDWDVQEKDDTLIGVSLDGKVHFLAAAVKAKTFNDAAEKSKNFYGDWMHDLTLADEPSMKKRDGMQIVSTRGTAKSKTDDEPLSFDMNIVSYNGKWVVIVAFGSQEALKAHAADIELTQASYRRVK